VIVGAAFCPHPPLLVPEIAAGAAAELDEVRVACSVALAALAASRPERLVVLGASKRSQLHSPVARGNLAAYGLSREFHLGSPGCGGDVDLPLSLTIGAWLVSQAFGARSGAIGFGVGPGFAASRAALDLLALVESSRIGLVVMGDGSARRSERAPGYLDPRAAGFDAGVEAALRAGDTSALADLPEQLGSELLAAGVPAWRAAGALFAADPDVADLLYADAPYGVGYFVASWLSDG
jgi:hypothetical protein